MVGNVLVDSSFYIDRLRTGLDPFEELGAQADDCDFFTCGVVMTEVLRGVKVARLHATMLGLFECMLYVPTSNDVWDRTHRLAWDLDRRGEFTQIPDLVIAICAIEADATLLTLDSDFRRVPKLRVAHTLRD